MTQHRTLTITLRLTVDEDGGTVTEGLCDSITDLLSQTDPLERVCEHMAEIIDAPDLGLLFGGLDLVDVTLDPVP